MAGLASGALFVALGGQGFKGGLSVGLGLALSASGIYFLAMRRYVQRRLDWPNYLPYGGAFGADITPHLTVAESRLADRPDDLVNVAALVEPQLPVTARIEEALLIAGTASPNSWGVVTRIPIGG